MRFIFVEDVTCDLRKTMSLFRERNCVNRFRFFKRRCHFLISDVNANQSYVLKNNFEKRLITLSLFYVHTAILGFAFTTGIVGVFPSTAASNHQNPSNIVARFTFNSTAIVDWFQRLTSPVASLPI